MPLSRDVLREATDLELVKEICYRHFDNIHMIMDGSNVRLAFKYKGAKSERLFFTRDARTESRAWLLLIENVKEFGL